MKIDYIPAAPAARWRKRRLLLVGALAVTVTAGALQVWRGGNAAIAGTATQPLAATAPSSLLVATPASPMRAAASAATVGGGDFDNIIQSAVSDALKVPEASQWTTVSVKPGQNLSVIFDALGLSHDELVELLALRGDVQRLKKLKAGDEIHIRIEDDELQALTYALDERRTLEVRRGEKGLEAVALTSEIEHRQVTVSGTIRDSLFLDGQRAHLSGRTIMEFADIFGYDIDFAQDLQPGDRFALVYEELYSKKGKKLRNGDILAAEFVNQGQRYRAIRFAAADGTTAYYAPNGQSLRKAFIRTPVDFARISSPFNLHRLHPILHTIRAHKGVDYAASIGTPIKATGDGKISYYGMKNGYGRVAMINHGSGVETLYGHMSRFRPGLEVGSRVRQGQVIGYVGMSGLATAPHLHYEFRVGGIHKNPVTVPLPRANPIAPRYLAAFRSQANTLVAALDRGNAVASAAGSTKVAR